jgi:hypothetical protein
VVVTEVVAGTSQEGFAFEWREVALLAFEGDMVSRFEIFDEADLGAALARFDELQPQAPRLENAASQVYERFQAHFAISDWDAIAGMLTADLYSDDRRPVVGGGSRPGRDALIEDLRAVTDVEITNATSGAIATRGGRLALARARYSRGRGEPDPFHVDFLQLVEIDAEDRITAFIAFDANDIDAAFEELDARYLAGEAAPHAHAWSVIARFNAAFNRQEIPAKDWVTIDHRRLITADTSDLPALIREIWRLTPDLNIQIEAVHRLSSLGAVMTRELHGTSQEGFEAEWRMIQLLTVEGDRISRSELFDEADLDTALARFEELHQQTPRLENAASRVDKRFQACFAARDWDVMAEMLAGGFSIEDRRRVVNMGNSHGRDAELTVHAYATVGTQNVKSTVIATRAQRLALNHYRFSGDDQRPDAFRIEMLAVVEIDADERMAAVVVFEVDDIDAAIAELDARYLAGEAAAHSHTWSVILRAYAALNRREPPSTTPDWVNIDHRRGASFAPGELPALLANWNPPDLSSSIEAVHRLNDLGAVFSSASHETSQEGFEAEWRTIDILTVEGDMVNRCEVFEEADLDAAIARFEELNRPAPQLENAASRAYDRMNAYFTARDWLAITEILADDVSTEDRRRVVNSGLRQGRDAVIAEISGFAEIGVTKVTSDIIATRGGPLVLSRAQSSGRDQRPEAFEAEVLHVVEIGADERIAAIVVFDPDDFDAAIAELDARYLAGEGAAHAHTWSIIAMMYTAFNRRELPSADWNSVDHRRGTPFASNDLPASIRSALDLTPDLSIHIETVHRLSSFGAVVTNTSSGTSQEGFQAEWRMIQLLTVEGDQINRLEVFDETDLHAALARFDELDRLAPRLENTASQVAQRFVAHYAARRWDAMAEILADGFSSEDRRRVVGAGVRSGRDAQIADLRAIADLEFRNLTPTNIATRGQRLVLMRARMSFGDQGPEAFLTDVLAIVEVDAEERMVALISFDPDDIDAAFAELDARYLAGEAAAYAHTWSVITGSYAAFNRHEVPAADWVTVDHRQSTPFEPSNMTPSVRTIWDLTPDLSIHIEAVHRLNNFGALITHEGHGTSHEGFDAEWRAVDLLTVDGDLIIRCEVFDEADLDAALVRFDELDQL